MLDNNLVGIFTTSSNHRFIFLGRSLISIIMEISFIDQTCKRVPFRKRNIHSTMSQGRKEGRGTMVKPGQKVKKSEKAFK